MVHDDDTGPRPYQAISSRDRPFTAVADISPAKAQRIQELVEQNPDFGPKMILACIRCTRHDITLREIQTVMSMLARQNQQRYIP